MKAYICLVVFSQLSIFLIRTVSLCFPSPVFCFSCCKSALQQKTKKKTKLTVKASSLTLLKRVLSPDYDHLL